MQERYFTKASQYKTIYVKQAEKNLKNKLSVFFCYLKMYVVHFDSKYSIMDKIIVNKQVN